MIGEAGLLREVEDGYRRGCRELVLSGGEPTLCLDTLHDVMRRADEVGYQKYIIQTNGSGFADCADLAPMIGEFARKADVAVSFSIHGHTAQIHDEMSRTPGAFEKLMCSPFSTGDYAIFHDAPETAGAIIHRPVGGRKRGASIERYRRSVHSAHRGDPILPFVRDGNMCG